MSWLDIGWNSSKRKRVLAGWLREHFEKEYCNSLKLQKFLFFYELLSKIDNSPYELRSLKGYINGPVFGEVYGDYTYNYFSFSADSIGRYRESLVLEDPNLNVNAERAELSCFLVRIHTIEELSELTHEFDIWKAKEEHIKLGVRHLALQESDLSENDIEKLNIYRKVYTPEFIREREVLNVSNKNFVISKSDLVKLTDEHFSVIEELSELEDLVNPVYLELDEDGVILVD